LGIMNNMQGSGPTTEPAPDGAPTDQGSDLVRAVLGDTEDTWGAIFQASGSQYPPPTLALFRGSIQSACGFASSASGPFYCPGDRKVYIDLAFYDELAQQFQAPGDFAQAYVLAHEVGHHVQNVLGTLEKVQAAQQRLGEAERNQLQVRVELQADCYAGIWAHHAEKSRGILEPGDIDEGLKAASAVGDDTIQRRMQGHVVPESFTHGSAGERMRWFTRGYESGELASCDTFSPR
ncbi:MAG: zinc metallopeptidase, partial [Steroidobacteraceae bacterium]|nr:zinc metallopeptidase [Steroidobacteraceae bacterium]